MKGAGRAGEATAFWIGHDAHSAGYAGVDLCTINFMDIPGPATRFKILFSSFLLLRRDFQNAGEIVDSGSQTKVAATTYS